MNESTVSTAWRMSRAERITRLVAKPRCMSLDAAVKVVDAAMFGIGCLEGKVREEQQKRIDAGEKL
jgi:hypothetical protein